MSAAGTAVLDRTSAPERCSDEWTSSAHVVGVPFPLMATPAPAHRRPLPATRVAPGPVVPAAGQPTTTTARSHSVRHRALVIAMWAAAAVAAWVLYRQVSAVDFGPVLAAADWWWVAASAGFFALALAGAAVNLVACSPARIGLARTYVVQVACGLVKLISPSAVGGAALNARYVQQSGVATPVAVAAVGSAQVIQLATTLALLGVMGPLTGTDAVPADVRGSTGLAILGAAAVAAAALGLLAAVALPQLRSRLGAMVHSVIAQARVVDLTPRSAVRRLALAVGGSVLLTVGLVLSLTASVAAMGGSVDPVSIGMAFLLGSAVGSIVPTPGGVGIVEAALVAALVASGQGVAIALPAVLIFRAVTVWVPVPVGLVAFHLLRRRGHV